MTMVELHADGVRGFHKYLRATNTARRRL